MSNVVTFRTNDRLFSMPHTTYQLLLLKIYVFFLFWNFFSFVGCIIKPDQPEEPDNVIFTLNVLPFLFGQKIISFTRQIPVTCDTQKLCLCCWFFFFFAERRCLCAVHGLFAIYSCEKTMKRHAKKKLQYFCDACEYLLNKVVFGMDAKKKKNERIGDQEGR